MKNLTTTLLLALSSVLSYGQSKIEYDTITIKRIETPQVIENRVLIATSFGSSQLSSMSSKLKEAEIKVVHLYYSLYKTSPDFDQEKLNQERISQLKDDNPNFRNEDISWKIIAQEEAKSKPDAEQLFHGFEVIYFSTPTKESIEKEISYLDELFPLCEEEISEEPETIDLEIPEVVEYIPDVSSKRKRSKSIKILGDRARDDWGDETTVLISSSAHTISAVYSNYDYKAIDYTKLYDICKIVYERNPNWDSTILITDVTGSMSPYLGATMAWIKTRSKESGVQGLTFFNDGNNMADRAKKTGKVGGIYHVENKDFGDVFDTMKKAMRAGGGGDGPENNIEATIKAEAHFNNFDEIVMLADNWATPRDLSLVADVDKPIHIILCGASYGINLQYLNLAYQSGGSVHTIEEDLDLTKIKPNKQFTVGGSTFTMVKGRIIKASLEKP